MSWKIGDGCWYCQLARNTMLVSSATVVGLADVGHVVVERADGERAEADGHLLWRSMEAAQAWAERWLAENPQKEVEPMSPIPHIWD